MQNIIEQSVVECRIVDRARAQAKGYADNSYGRGWKQYVAEMDHALIVETRRAKGLWTRPTN